MNSLKQTLLLTAAVVTFIIGVHRTTIEGLQANYWLFMLSTVALMIYRYNVKKEQEKKLAEKQPQATPSKKKKKKSK